MDGELRIAVVEPTGAVGREIIEVLRDEELPVGALRLLGTGEAVGESIDLEGGPQRIEELTEAALAGIDLVFFPPGRDLAARFVPAATRAGAAVIDTSSASREDPAVPLVSPFVNEEALDAIGSARGRVVALPSAPAAQLAAVLLPIATRAGIARVNVVSLEAVSGAGLAGVEELSRQTIGLLNAQEPGPSRLPQRVAFNLVPQVGTFEGAVTSRERKTAGEVRRLLDLPLPALAITSFTVPVFYGHTQVVTVETERELKAAAAREALRDVARVLDEPEAGVLPGPALAVGDDALHVGRVREVPLGLVLVSVADNVRWGTAVPAVKVAALLLREGKL